MPASAIVPTAATMIIGNRQLDCPSARPTGTPRAVAVIQPPSTNDNALPRCSAGVSAITYPATAALSRLPPSAAITRPPSATG